MIHAFAVMGVPECVLTDNMKSEVVLRRRRIDSRPYSRPTTPRSCRARRVQDEGWRGRHPTVHERRG